MLSDRLCKDLKAIASNFIPAKDLDDLTQEVFEQLLNMNSEKLEDLIEKGDIYRYFNRMCKLNYYSKNSRYYYTYNKMYELITFREHNEGLKLESIGKKYIDENLYNNIDADLINDLLSELYWYDRELFKLYVLGDSENNTYSYTSLSKKTGISRISIYYTIRSVKKYITKRLNEVKNDL